MINEVSYYEHKKEHVDVDSDPFRGDNLIVQNSQEV